MLVRVKEKLHKLDIQHYSTKKNVSETLSNELVFLFLIIFWEIRTVGFRSYTDRWLTLNFSSLKRH